MEVNALQHTGKIYYRVDDLTKPYGVLLKSNLPGAREYEAFFVFYSNENAEEAVSLCNGLVEVDHPHILTPAALDWAPDYKVVIFEVNGKRFTDVVPRRDHTKLWEYSDGKFKDFSQDGRIFMKDMVKVIAYIHEMNLTYKTIPLDHVFLINNDLKQLKLLVALEKGYGDRDMSTMRAIQAFLNQLSGHCGLYAPTSSPFASCNADLRSFYKCVKDARAKGGKSYADIILEHPVLLNTKEKMMFVRNVESIWRSERKIISSTENLVRNRLCVDWKVKLVPSLWCFVEIEGEKRYDATMQQSMNARRTFLVEEDDMSNDKAAEIHRFILDGRFYANNIKGLLTFIRDSFEHFNDDKNEEIEDEDIFKLFLDSIPELVNTLFLHVNDL